MKHFSDYYLPIYCYVIFVERVRSEVSECFLYRSGDMERLQLNCSHQDVHPRLAWDSPPYSNSNGEGRWKRLPDSDSAEGEIVCRAVTIACNRVLVYLIVTMQNSYVGVSDRETREVEVTDSDNAVTPLC